MFMLVPVGLTGDPGHKFEGPQDPDGAQGLQVQAVLLFRLDLLVLRREDGYIPRAASYKDLVTRRG